MNARSRCSDNPISSGDFLAFFSPLRGMTHFAREFIMLISYVVLKHLCVEEELGCAFFRSTSGDNNDICGSERDHWH